MGKWSNLDFHYLCSPGFRIFFETPAPDRFVDARAIAVRAALPNAMNKDAASNPRGMASSLRDISGQLDRVKKIYTQYLTIAAKSYGFIPGKSTATPVIQTWIPRIWMDKFASHTLASLLIFVAIYLSILQYAHRKQRSRLFLAGPTGSIAFNVSMTSSAKFGLLLNAGDTEADLERKLQGMRFGIEHSTGQVIVEREDKNHIAGYVKEEMRRAQEGVRYHEDVRASLLSNERGPGAVHRDTFIGLRSQDRESDGKGGWRISAVGSLAPSLSSPGHSASFSQTKFAPLLTSNGMLSPVPIGSPTPLSPSPSASTTRFSTARYTAPLGPPPDRTSYHDPYAQNPV